MNYKKEIEGNHNERHPENRGACGAIYQGSLLTLYAFLSVEFRDDVCYENLKLPK